MNASPPSLPRPPLSRDLKLPYFLLRTPDGLGSYFSQENLPLVASRHEPLSRFLAPARISEQGPVRRLNYEFTPAFLESARPLDVLPQSEIDAFALAAQAFYAKAHPATPRIVPHEKRLRASFRLPDPDLEPDAYWVYGPVNDRRLLILWGAEAQAGTSLPLAPDAVLNLPAGRTILERLQARAMTWETRQREALRFAFDPAEPISQFLARRAVNASGAPAGLSNRGQNIAPKRFRPLRRVFTSECAAFDRAARAFYDKAAAAGATAYEREIRQAFRLPNPATVPGAYFLSGRRLLAVVDGGETREKTLPLIQHSVLPPSGPPPAEPAAGGADWEMPVVIPAASGNDGGLTTVSAALWARSISSGLVTAIAAAAAVVAVAGSVGIWRMAVDRTPPRVVESADFPAALARDRVAVKFSKPVSAQSFHPATEARPSFVFGDDDARVEGAEVDPKDPTRVILATSPLRDGRTYRLTIDNLADRSGHPLREPTSVSFKYLDLEAPKITVISAGENANQLVLVFSKPMAEATVARGGNFALFALEGGGEGASQRIASGRLDPEDKTGRTVILEGVHEFVGNQPYRLDSLAGVTDASVSRNLVALPPTGMDFAYRDVLPPRIRGISASVSKLELTVTFSKPVDPALARDVANYAIVAPDKTALSLRPGPATLDSTGRSVTLRLAVRRLAPGICRLTVRPMRDRAGNRDAAPLQAAFEFADADNSALKVISHSLVAADNHVDNKVTLTFNRALDPEISTQPSNYTLWGADHAPLELAVAEARRVPDNPAQVILILNQPPTAGVKVTVRVAAAADIFGQKNAGPIEYAFTPPGIPDPSEQVLDWTARPVLRGNSLLLAIREAVARPSALASANYLFNASAARVRGVIGYEVKTDPKSGSRSTLVVLQVDVPAAARRGLTLRARNLRAAGLEFLGAQALPPLAVAQP